MVFSSTPKEASWGTSDLGLRDRVALRLGRTITFSDGNVLLCRTPQAQKGRRRTLATLPTCRP